MEKDLKRQISILNILVEEKKWFTIYELEQKVKCSSKTIRKDISIINDLLPKDSTIRSVKGRGIQLFLAPDQSISEIISNNFFQKSLTFRTLQQLLEGNSHTVISLSESLYIPIHLMNTVLRRVENYIDKFGLVLEKRPLRIIGDELHIILMFCELYLEAFAGDNWPFSEYQAETFSKNIAYIEERLDIKLFVSDKRRLTFFIIIFLKRQKQGYKIKLSEDIIKSTIESPYYQKIFKTNAEINIKGNISLSIEERVLLVVAIKLARYSNNDEEKSKNDELTLFRGGKIKVYRCVSEFIHMLEQKLEIELINKDEFVYGMIDYCRRVFHKLTFLSKLQTPEKTTTKFIKETHYQTFSLVKDVYKNWGNNIGIYHIPEEEVAKVTMRILATGLASNKEHKKALLITDEGASWNDYMKHTLLQKFGERLEIVNEVDGEITEDNIKKMDIDFVVTTMPININSKPLICVSLILQERDFNEIETILH